jgi:hypothetical protein
MMVRTRFTVGQPLRKTLAADTIRDKALTALSDIVRL